MRLIVSGELGRIGGGCVCYCEPLQNEKQPLMHDKPAKMKLDGWFERIEHCQMACQSNGYHYSYCEQMPKSEYWCTEYCPSCLANFFYPPQD